MDQVSTIGGAQSWVVVGQLRDLDLEAGALVGSVHTVTVRPPGKDPVSRKESDFTLVP